MSNQGHSTERLNVVYITFIEITDTSLDWTAPAQRKKNPPPRRLGAHANTGYVGSTRRSV